MINNQITLPRNIFNTLLKSGLGDLNQIGSFVDDIIKLVNSGLVKKEEIQLVLNDLPEEFEGSLQSHGLRKPFGYTGDFLIIDRMYTTQVSSNKAIENWDIYFHNQPAVIAVRNRKEYFKSVMHQKLKSKTNFKLLNIASGPARDLKEVYDSLDGSQVLNTTCVDMDINAIDYAVKLNADYLNDIEFVEKNIFKYSTDKKYDLVWSAGLFDYFTDRAFVLCLKKLKMFTAQGGEIIIGNFNEDNNPSRDYMEVFGDWNLIHRSKQKLIDLALQAGFTSDQIIVGREEQDVNLFLHIKVN